MFSKRRPREKHPRFEFAPRDDRSSKNEPKRVENDRDTSLQSWEFLTLFLPRREEAVAADGARADCAAARGRLAQALAAYDAKKAAADAHASVDPVADARDRAKRLAAAADEKSCDVASDYASGACDTKQFIERYLEARKAYHLETSLAAACARPGTGLPVVDV